MYSRALRSVIIMSTKLRDQKVSKKLSTISPVLIVQKLLSCTNINCSVQPFSSDIFKSLTKDPLKRKQDIDGEAQKKIDDLLAEKPETEKLIKVLELELTVMRQDGHRVPSNLRPRDWWELIHLESHAKRRKFLNYLFITEKQREKEKQEKIEINLQKEDAQEERRKATERGEIIYGIGYNSMMRRITEPTMNQLYNWNSLKAIIFGNKIVFDCSYEQLMSPLELKSCAKQILESYAINRTHNFPFEVFLCNANPSGQLISKLANFIPTLFDDDFAWTVTTKSYLELFERSKLVYLTSNCNNVLKEYDSNSVYIIGAYVDKGSKQRVSLAKAKEQNLKMAKLPLDKLHFGDGSNKDLTLNQVCHIMLDAQCGDWDKALQHVPKRKLYESRIRSLERKVQRDAIRFRENLNDTGISRGRNSPKFESAEVYDFSHEARAKLRNQWNKS